jgi:hypothetical protein
MILLGSVDGGVYLPSPSTRSTAASCSYLRGMATSLLYFFLRDFLDRIPTFAGSDYRLCCRYVLTRDTYLETGGLA